MIEHGQIWQDRGEHGLAADGRLAGADRVPRSAGGRRCCWRRATSSCARAAGECPSCATGDGELPSVEAVIDKDLTAALLGRQLGVDVLVIATDVDAGRRRLGHRRRPSRSAPCRPRQLRDLAAEGHFAGGSMGPKVDAACRFAESGGRAVITSSARIADALAGAAGTIVIATDDPPTREEYPCPSRSRSARSRCTASPTRASSRSSSTTACSRPTGCIAVIGKTEGNGGVNDYTRIIADRAFREVLVAKGSRSADEVKQMPIVWSGGTDGVISPHATIFATVPADQARRRPTSRG